MQISRTTRTTLAVLIAPLAAIPSMLILFWALTLSTGGDGQLIELISWASGLIGALVAYPVTLAIGLPAHIYLYRRRMDSYGVCVAFGAGVGLIVGLIIAADEVLSIIIGASVALAFRAIAGSQRNQLETVE